MARSYLIGVYMDIVEFMDNGKVFTCNNVIAIIDDGKKLRVINSDDIERNYYEIDRENLAQVKIYGGL